MKYFIISLATIVSAVLAAPVEYFFDIKQPQENNVFRVGQNVPLTWEHGTGGRATVTVLKGDEPTEMVPTSYQFEIDGNSRSASWKVPPGLSTSEKYSFEITYSAGSNQQEGKSYSKQFTISNDVPTEQGTVATISGDNGGKKNKGEKGNSSMIGGGGSMQETTSQIGGGPPQGTVQGNPQQMDGHQVQGTTRMTQGGPTVQSNSMSASQGRTSAAQANGVMPMQGSNKMAMVSNGNPVNSQAGYAKKGSM